MPGIKREADVSLIEQMRSGDSNGLNQVYRMYYPAIRSLVLRNNGSEYEAKDVFQESVILLFEKLQQPGFTLTCSIKTFLYAVSHRLWLKKWNEKKIKVYNTRFEAEPSGMEEIIGEYEEQQDDMDKMRRSLEGLGEPCASLLNDFYIHEMSMTAIAEKYGYTNPDNAKNQKYKCLQRLKKIFFKSVFCDFRKVL